MPLVISEKKTPSLWFTAILAALLFMPFVIRLFLVVEIYPSVIMPSGAGKIDISDGHYPFVHYRAYGVLSNGEQEEIDMLELIKPVHRHYVYSIFNNQFGLNPDATKRMKLRGTEWVYFQYPQRGATLQQQAECKEMLKQGWSDRYAALLLQKVTVRVEMASKNWIEETIDENIRIEL